jgi:hypothetical protein
MTKYLWYFNLGIESVTFNDREDLDPHQEELKNFKTGLCKSIIDRFTNDKEKGERIIGSNGKNRQIVTVDIFHNSRYILAALLDPRIKTAPFLGNFL